MDGGLLTHEWRRNCCFPGSTKVNTNDNTARKVAAAAVPRGEDPVYRSYSKYGHDSMKILDLQLARVRGSRMEPAQENQKSSCHFFDVKNALPRDTVGARGGAGQPAGGV